MNKVANLILPDFLNIQECSYLLTTFQTHKEVFKKNINIIGLVGMFPGCVWNNKDKKFNMYKRIYNLETLYSLRDKYNTEYKISLYIKFDNENIKEKELKDVFGNNILTVFNSRNNYVIVYSDVLKEYIKNNYKEINIVEVDNLTKDNMSVLNFKYNKENSLFKNENKEGIILQPDCDFIPIRRNLFHHSKKDSTLNPINPKKADKYYTKNDYTSFKDIVKNENYLSYETLLEYSKNGINKFILSGIGVYNVAMLINIVEYLCNDDYKIDIRSTLFQHLLNYKELEIQEIKEYRL